jgi:Tol biopolymer transport system component
VAFTSGAGDVDAGAGDVNGLTDVFLFDRLTSGISLVSRDAATGQAAGGTDPLVSADGSSVAFLSTASGLVPGQVSPAPGTHLFLFNRSTGTMTLVSHAAGSTVTTADQGPFTTAFSASREGRWIAFTSTATNLAAGQVEGNSGQDDVFLFDRATGTNVLVSHTAGSPVQTGNGASRDPSISADGRWVAFASTAADLVAGRTGGVYLWDRTTGGLAWVGPGDQPEISDDGRWIAFQSTAADVVPGQADANAGTDVFLWDRVTAATILVSRSAVSATTAGNGTSAFSSFPQSDSPDVLSTDGRRVVFTSNATDLVPGVTDGNNRADVFLFDREDGTTALVSHASTSSLNVANNESQDPGISADGSRVAFLSVATNLVPGQVDTNVNWDLFLYHRQTGDVRLASRAAASPSQAGNVTTSLLPRLSADGSFLAFTSQANNLVSGDFQVDNDAFLFSDPPAGRDFFTLPPCRLLDTRSPGQGPALASGLPRVVPVHGVCGVPPEARTIVANITVTQPTGAGYVALHPGDTGAPGTSTLNVSAGQTRANNTIVSLALDGTGSLAITPWVMGNGTLHVVVDISGWFEEPQP